MYMFMRFLMDEMSDRKQLKDILKLTQEKMKEFGVGEFATIIRTLLLNGS